MKKWENTTGRKIVNRSRPADDSVVAISRQGLSIFFLKIYLFIYFWLHRVLVAGFSLVVACKVFFFFSSLVVAHRLQGAWAL